MLHTNTARYPIKTMRGHIYAGLSCKTNKSIWYRRRHSSDDFFYEIPPLLAKPYDSPYAKATTTRHDTRRDKSCLEWWKSIRHTTDVCFIVKGKLKLPSSYLTEVQSHYLYALVHTRYLEMWYSSWSQRPIHLGLGISFICNRINEKLMVVNCLTMNMKI